MTFWRKFCRNAAASAAVIQLCVDPKGSTPTWSLQSFREGPLFIGKIFCYVESETNSASKRKGKTKDSVKKKHLCMQLLMKEKYIFRSNQFK